ncbi:MAG TPA: YjgN family protein [Nevskiaceae bacterium]|nr:YjgN family protein [Nevskiaceae bacterium]
MEEVALPPPLPPEPPTPPPVVEPMRFTGSGGEYFRIWIVNLLLTVLTLGIYSAWAKVRRLKYFDRHTELAGARFDYHGAPIAILKGRVIAIALLIAYQHAFDVSVTVGLITVALMAIVLPWLIRNSFRFRLHNTSYRGLRFAFKGGLSHAYYVFLVGALGSVFTLYAAMPFFHQRLKAYQHGNAWYGATRFSFTATPGAFYRVYLVMMGLMMLFMFGMGVLIAVGVGLFAHPGATADGKPSKELALGITLGIVALYFALILCIAPYLTARLQNLVWNHTGLGPHRFVSTLSARRLFWIYLTNLLGAIVTLGLYAPWASVRLARYRVESVSLVALGSLDDVVAGAPEDVGATGQEAAEFFDIDIAL